MQLRILALLLVTVIFGTSVHAEPTLVGEQLTAASVRHRRTKANAKFITGILFTVFGLGATATLSAIAADPTNRQEGPPGVGIIQLTVTPALFCVGIPLIAKGVEERRETERLAPLVNISFDD